MAAVKLCDGSTKPALRLISKSSGILKAGDFFHLSLPGVISFSVNMS